MKTPELEERVEKTSANMCANALLEGRDKEGWKSGIWVECLTIPFFRSPSAPPLFVLIPLLSFYIGHPLLFFNVSLSPPPLSLFSFSLSPFVLLNSTCTYILHGLYLHTAKSFAWFHGNFSIPELKFKGAVRAVFYTTWEHHILRVLRRPSSPDSLCITLRIVRRTRIFARLSSFRFRFIFFFSYSFLFDSPLVYVHIP